MERPGFALLHNRLSIHHVPVVGATIRFHLHQSPDDALSRFWIL